MAKKRKQSKKPDSNFKPVFDTQHEDEEVLMVVRRHPVVMRKGLIAVLLGLLLGMLPSLAQTYDLFPSLLGEEINLAYLWFAPLGGLIGGIYLFYEWVGWYYSVFIVTDQRLIQINQKGFFNRAVVDIGLDKIQNINFQVSGVQETLLRFGTILVQTFAGDLIMDHIHHPAKVQEHIVKIIKELGFSSFNTGGSKSEEEDE